MACRYRRYRLWRRGLGRRRCDGKTRHGAPIVEVEELPSDSARQHLGEQRWNGITELTLRIGERARDFHAVRKRLKARHLAGGEPAVSPMERTRRGTRLCLQS